MYVQLTTEDLALLVAALSTLTVAPAKELCHRLQEKIDLSLNQRSQEIDAAYVAAAQAQHGDDGFCEIDDGALVSIGDDPGAYVMAWVWVDAADAGICVQCGATDADNGEGYDGLCGTCADRAEVAHGEGGVLP
ncbi:MAG: hypothetical protein ACT4OK_11195 [Gemmobacter sp.]